MVLAIGLPGQRPVAAEVEIIVAGMAARPHANRPGEVEDVAPRRRLFGDDARRQPDAVHLADHRILADPDAAADLGGGPPLFPQPRQLLDTLRRPGRLDLRRRAGFCNRNRLQRPGPIHRVFPRILWLAPQPPQDTVSLLWVGANRYLHVVVGRGRTTTSVSYHLRKVSDRARLRGKARPNQPVEILGEVTRIVWLMEARGEIVEQRVVIGL